LSVTWRFLEMALSAEKIFSPVIWISLSLAQRRSSTQRR